MLKKFGKLYPVFGGILEKPTDKGAGAVDINF